MKMAKFLLPLIYFFALLGCQSPVSHEKPNVQINSSLVMSEDSSVINYIRQQERFVAITDKEELPTTVQIYYDEILSFLSKDTTGINNYYVDTTSVVNERATVSIPIYHYDGFKREKEIKDRNSIETMWMQLRTGNTNVVIVTDINGNLSGKDGALEISKKTKKVLRFSLWL